MDTGEVDAGDGPLRGVLAMMFLVRSSKGEDESSGCPVPSGRSDMLPGCNPGVGGAPASACSACQTAVT